MLVDVILSQPIMKEELLKKITVKRLASIINATHKGEAGLALMEEHPRFSDFLDKKSDHDAKTQLMIQQALGFVNQVHGHIDEDSDLTRGSKWKMTMYHKETFVNDLKEEEVRFGNPKEIDEVWKVVKDERGKKCLKCKKQNKEGQWEDKFKPIKARDDSGLFIYANNAKGITVLGPRYDATTTAASVRQPDPLQSS
jgi:hypothetical protein